MTMVIDVISKGRWIGFPEIVTENFHETVALCGKEIYGPEVDYLVHHRRQ